MAFRYSPKIVTDGLVLYLDAANSKSYPGSGVDWNDLSKSRHLATVNGNPTFSSEYSGEFNLDGTGDYFTIPQSFGDFSNSVCSYEIWCYPTSFPSGGQILFMDRPIFSNNYGVEIFVLNSLGTLTVRGSSSVAVNSTEKLQLNKWNHIVVNYSGTSTESYINNVYEDMGIITEVSGSTYDLYVGKYPTIANTYDWNGKISLVRVYNKTLNASEVSQNYNTLKNRFGL